LDILPGSKPFYGKPFSIPKAYLKVTRDTIDCSESIGLLTKLPLSKWAAPIFIIPKKNGTVRVNTSFHGLNKCLKCIPYPMPKTPDIFKGLEHFQYATTIDLNMGYYSMHLDDKVKCLCIINLPWGLYCYNMLPQGIKVATDIFQARMGSLFYDMPTAVVFMDNNIVFSYTTFDDHLDNVAEILK
jgi:hypothetical protein